MNTYIIALMAVVGIGGGLCALAWGYREGIREASQKRIKASMLRISVSADAARIAAEQMGEAFRRAALHLSMFKKSYRHPCEVRISLIS